MKHMFESAMRVVMPFARNARTRLKAPCNMSLHEQGTHISPSDRGGRIPSTSGRLSRQLGNFLVLLGLTASSLLGLSGPAQAVVVSATPTWPIPSYTALALPPIPTLPLATAETPPASAIADPVTSRAPCRGWYQQERYGDRWPAGSMWWEYACALHQSEYYPHPCPEIGACEAVCYGYPYDCYEASEDRTDYFYWDGSDAVFYGQAYTSSISDANGYYSTSSYWWDSPTGQWYLLGDDSPSSSLTVSKQGSGAGQVTSTPAGIVCGETCQDAFETGTAVTLTATPDSSSIFTGWSGDCSGTGMCQLTTDQARSVTATFKAIVYRPDALIRPSSTSSWAGDDVYSPTGAGETVSTTAARGTMMTFHIGAQNDGNVADTMTVAGPEGFKGFAVHYYDGTMDVTTEVVQGTYSTGPGAPGSYVSITMTVTIAKAVRSEMVKSWLIHVTSHGIEDGVNAMVNVV
jgi:Divergent InlB B-repeat domain